MTTALMSISQLQQIQNEIEQHGLKKVIDLYKDKLLKEQEQNKAESIFKIQNNIQLTQSLQEFQQTLQIVYANLNQHIQWKNTFSSQLNTALDKISTEINGTEEYANNQSQQELTTRIEEDDMVQIGLKLGVLKDFAAQALKQLKTRAKTVAAKLKIQHDRQAILGRRLLTLEQSIKYKVSIKQNASQIE